MTDAALPPLNPRSAEPSGIGAGPSSVPAAALVPPGAWAALVVLLAGMFMALLDTTIVNVALPTIRTSLDASEATLSWIVSGYALAFGIALIPAGRIGDRIGHKWVFFTGLALFTLASLFCGLAQDDVQLIVARVVQGLAGGLFVPAVTAMIQLMFPPTLRGKAFAIMGAVIGVSTALGPILGGLIIEAFGSENGWRGVFWVNLPIGVVALIAAVILLPAGREIGHTAPVPAAATSVAQTGPQDHAGDRGRPARGPGVGAGVGVDWTGFVLLTGGLVALLVPLIEGQDRGWPVWTYVSLVGGVLLLVAFALWEVRIARGSGDPLVPPHLFSHPAFSGGVVLAMVYFAAFTSIFFTISLLWQAGLGHTALESGLVSIPFAIGSIVGASQSDRLATRFGRTVLIVGTALVAAGLAWVWIVLLRVPAADLTNWDLLVPLFIGGIGSGLFIAPNARFIVATVDRTEAGAASGVIAVAQRVGAAIGIAIIGSVLFGSLTNQSIRGPQDVGPAFVTSAGHAMGVSVAFAVAALLLVFVLPNRVGDAGVAPIE